MAKGGYQRRRIEQKHQAEKDARRRARQRRKLAQWSIGAVVVIILIFAAFPRGSGKWGLAFASRTGFFGASEASPSASASASPSATGSSAPNAGCSAPGATPPKKGLTFAKAPEMKIDTTKTHIAHLKTSCGDITIELETKKAPKTVNNFVFLAQKKFYDHTIFHRVIPDFGGPGSDMVQGGDAVNGDGTGDPGYKFGDENMAPFTTPGTIAMANSGPGTNGSQFFLLDGTVAHLNKPGACPGSGCHSVFGKVTAGLDVIKTIAKVQRGPNDAPLTSVELISVTIETK